MEDVVQLSTSHYLRITSDQELSCHSQLITTIRMFVCNYIFLVIFFYRMITVKPFLQNYYKFNGFSYNKIAFVTLKILYWQVLYAGNNLTLVAWAKSINCCYLVICEHIVINKLSFKDKTVSCCEPWLKKLLNLNAVGLRSLTLSLNNISKLKITSFLWKPTSTYSHTYNRA